MVKISFLGDIMCEEPFLNAAKCANGYDFNKAFAGMKEICSKSDYVIANLETPFAGEEKQYTHEMYSFNTPDSFVDALKNMGVSMVLTANNHCCDRGIDGLLHTLEVLDKKNMPHTGTYKIPEENIFFTNINGINISVISCTANTNAPRTGCKADNTNVNLLSEQRPINPLNNIHDFLRYVKRFFLKRIIGEKNVIILRKLLGKKPKEISYDDKFQIDEVEPYFERIERLINKAKENADFVFVCPHMGGQFNVRCGNFSEYAMKRFVECGVNAVVASHSHISQKADYINGVPCFYSLGNVSMSMSTPYILRQDFPDYGIMCHFYINNSEISKTTFSLIKIVEENNGFLNVMPLRDLYIDASKKERDTLLMEAQIILKRIFQNEKFICEDIWEEYDLVQGGEKNDEL